ncbi:MAG: ATP synthase gamma chain [Candidatus Uhrbacteria bacterium GW2011_GWF2_39_13]|uniref:ATP synthase gamma chain n=1 Tax=Candidatus Uhrbacteria bacterium GW2011_GWF2_39_13 TaxID=1618995 RepID=A0A0G0Q2J2_9BACT|nr:MAG: ATP synthase gamma chain [Candidatus Uhrbacteria bacterium GW2011_GWF2_39_13]HAU66451.1 ATP synthase F1 subunit gamma [Candidatus Uhrbacteria bacterium]
MAIQTRTIKRRIKSVKNTRKITKAMELVAASKMRKAISSVVSSRPYSKLAWETVKSLTRTIDTSLHPLLKRSPEVKHVLLVLITSDRGLAGGFNTNIIKKTRESIKSLGSGVKIQTICIGKRGADAMRRLQIPMMASFLDITNNTKFEEILPIGRMIINEFNNGSFDRVLVAYTDFVSAVTQVPLILELLPLSSDQDQNFEQMQESLFEPSPALVLDHLLPRLVETMVYQAILESSASEHSSRMMAMRNASDSAGEMLQDLTFTFNQARQAGITQEIAEISSGKAALEG